MFENFGVKDLYEVAFKAIEPMEIFGKQFDKDEVVMYFEKIQMSNMSVPATAVQATGGRGNFPLVGWESINDMTFQFENGLISKFGFGLLSQSTFYDEGAFELGVPVRESLISNSNGIIETKYLISTAKPIFAYKVINGVITEKITPIDIENNTIDFGSTNSFVNIIIDYYFVSEAVSAFEIGGERIKGFLKMTSKINFVDEKEGVRKTVLFTMPKMKLSSGMSMTLGIQANPIVSTFRMTAYPGKDGKTLGRFFFLNEDIEG